MSSPARTRPRRTPWTWQLRLAGWLVVLGLLVATVLLAVRSGSYGATTHTTAAEPAPALPGEPAAAVQQVNRVDGTGVLAGSTVADIGEHGVVSRDAVTGEELWRYTRSDTTVCAQYADAIQVLLVYASGERCDEAISLDTATGARKWQRTIEAAGENRVVVGADGMLSIDPAKLISYETGQGFERFTIDNSTTDHIEGEHTSCENLDAAGSALVATLQRCRADEDAPWIHHVLISSPSDGNAREVGRSYLNGVTDPDLLGVTQDGTAIVRDAAGSVLLYPATAQNPTSISGLPPLDGELTVIAGRGSIVISDATTAYLLDPSRTSVAAAIPVIAPPTQHGTALYIPTAAGIELRAADTGALSRTIAIEPAPSAPLAVTVSGQLVGVRDETGLSVYQ